MRCIRPFVRDIELHGHHSECLARFNGMDEHPAPCVCKQLDLDDWLLAVEHARDTRKERMVEDE